MANFELTADLIHDAFRDADPSAQDIGWFDFTHLQAAPVTSCWALGPYFHKTTGRTDILVKWTPLFQMSAKVPYLHVPALNF